LDFAVANNGSDSVSVLLGNGDGSFQTIPVSYVAGSLPWSVAVADLDGDGWLDLATANSTSDDVSILLNDGVWNGGGPGGAPGGPGAPDLFAATDLDLGRIAAAWPLSAEDTRTARAPATAAAEAGPLPPAPAT